MALVAGVCDETEMFLQASNGTIRCDPSSATFQLVQLDTLTNTSDPTTTIQELNDVLNTIFSTPSSTEIIQAFSAGITLPLICWLTAWGFGVVVNWFREGKGRYLDD